MPSVAGPFSPVLPLRFGQFCLDAALAQPNLPGSAEPHLPSAVFPLSAQPTGCQIVQRHACPCCQQEIYPQNTACLNCGADLVFAPRQGVFVEVAQSPGGPCCNRAAIACNWQAETTGGLCLSCAHTTVVPDLGLAGNAERWERLETAKRALILMLVRLGLPLVTAEGIAVPRFELKGDPVDSAAPRVLTGHENGTITINIAEADDAERARIRAQMQEPYRTLAGHFRHEVAHHYWEVLTAADPARIAALRVVFGDERQDYAAALQSHYVTGAPSDWPERFISAYASAHPWEDFAETWAHVLHMLDGLETAQAFGLILSGPPRTLERLVEVPMPDLARDWISLSLGLNAVNQAMGHEAFYPFVLSPAVIDKLEAVRALMAEAGARGRCELG
ncbi:zinc-binding metallopeptidase family protein [Rhodobacter lacus]|uniref:Zinc-binding metallopeptidase n=1 Tax=Rhodobacter lacus TaxID=1641972 RepID=A0ABW5A592_9RHOB